MIKLRPHQSDAWKCIKSKITKGKGSAVGRIVMPTGAGKTFVEARLIEHQITKNSVSKIHLVLAPRILLANQLISEYRKFDGSPYRAIAFHSGTHEPDYEKVKWQEISTTRTDSLKDEWVKAQRLKQDLVVFSTYHSCGKLAGIDFDTIIADESQYCVVEDFNNAIRSLTGRVKMFFTATERFTASNAGRGLNNTTVYGERLYSISPAELIRLGLIVAPRLHIMYGETRDEGASIISEILELAQEQDRQTHPKLGFSKILMAMSGTDDVKTVIDNINRIRKEMPLHDIFTITSKTGAMINGVKIRREEFMTELTRRENCLIFHYDILSEGIDVDGITGVGLMRNMGLAKLLQTIGRAIRIYKPNPALKTEAWISVPVINGNHDDKEQVKQYVNAIRNAGFDVSAETVHESGKPRHTPDSEEVEDAYGKYRNNFSSLFITDVMHDIEKDEFWNKIKISETMENDLDLLFT